MELCSIYQDGDMFRLYRGLSGKHGTDYYIKINRRIVTKYTTEDEIEAIQRFRSFVIGSL